MMDLSVISHALSYGLTKFGWQTVVEDDNPDFKQLVCQNSAGPLRIFTRLDVLIMTPELNPADASGICLCFLYYADPTIVVDMFKLGRTIRQDESQLFRSHTESILNASKVIAGNPSIKVHARPKGLIVRFSEDNSYQPAFMVEVGYWLSCEKFPFERTCTQDVTHFTVMLEDQVIHDRTEAIYALRGSDLTETEVLLLNAASDINPQIRIAALTVLSEYCDNNYLSLFENTLNDGDETVRRFAGEYLKTYRKHIRSGPIINTRLSVSDCIKALASKNDAVREKAVRDLEGFTEPRMIMPLLRVVKNSHNSSTCRWHAIQILDNFDCPGLLYDFFSLLRDEKVGMYAASCLSSNSSPLANNLLIKALYSENKIVQLSAARGFGPYGNQKAVQHILPLLEENDLELQQAAISFMFRTIGHLYLDVDKDQPVSISSELPEIFLNFLLKLINEKDDEIRIEAILYLCAMDKAKGAPFLMAELEKYIHIATGKTYQAKNDPWDFDPYKYNLDRAIFILADKSFCEPLVRLFNSKCWSVKIKAATSLKNLGDNRGLGLLEEALNHEDWNVWSCAAYILFPHDNRIWDVLVRAISENAEDHSFIKTTIIDTLVKSGDSRTVDVLCNILNNSDAYYLNDMDIGRIITCLGELGDPRAIESIKKWQYKELINCHDDVVEQALRSLGEL